MRRIVAILAGTLLATSALSAQDPTQPGPDRQLIHRVAPVYPDLARRAGITGVVKLVVVVGPNGSVKSVDVLGGNPVLIPAAKDAVKEWEYTPAPQESRQMIELRFSSH